MEENKDKGRNEIFSERVRAGKRTYFFDIKATRSNDYYLTITERKRRYKEDGFVYEKHKIFLYKEDFEKFANALNLSIEHVKTELLPGVDFNEFHRVNKEQQSGGDMPINESAITEEPTSEEPSEVPTNEEPTSEEPSEVPTNEEPISEESVSEPVSKEQVGEEPVSEEPVGEESASEEPNGEVSDEVEVEAEATDGSEESDLKWD